jgi:hypothetical protein
MSFFDTILVEKAEQKIVFQRWKGLAVFGTSDV